MWFSMFPSLGDTTARSVQSRSKLQASVYDILPPNTAIIGYAVDLRKMSANSLAQFLVGAQRMPNSL